MNNQEINSPLNKEQFPKENEGKSKSIGNYIQLQGGFAFKSTDFKESGIPLIRISNVTLNGLDKSDVIFLPREYEIELRDFLAKKNDTLIAMSGATTGKCCIIKQSDLPCLINQRVGRFKIINENEVDKIFVYFIVSSSQFQNELLKDAIGGAQPNVSPKQIEKIYWNFPPLPAQQKIAKILSTADAVIEKTQAAIAKYKAIKQGLLHDLFTRGVVPETVKIQNEKGEEEEKTVWKLRPTYQEAPHLYKESKLGMVPIEWEVERLESLTDKIGSGVTPTGGSEIYQSSGVLFIRSQNVLVGCLSIEDAAFITSEIDEKMEGSRVKPFDVLLNITGASIGRCAYFPLELTSANVNQHVCIIRFKNISKSLAVYASEFLNSDFGQSQINKLNAGGNREGLNFQQIKSFYFPVVEVSELEKIAERLVSIDAKLQTEQAYLQKLHRLKAGLMGDLLSGKVRV